MEYIEIDVHQRESRVCILDERGQVLIERRVRTSRERFAELLGVRAGAGDVPGTPGHLSVIVDEPPGVDPACLEVAAGYGPIPKPSGDLSIIDG
jgi:hypothetical protein